jgi:hypothetical protein
MKDNGPVARFYPGSTFGKFKFVKILPEFGMFLDDNGVIASYQQFQFEPGTEYSDICVNELIDLFYTPRIVEPEKEEDPRVPSVKTEKPRFVKFIRYARPCRDGEIDNLRGITFYFVLDYENEEVMFGYSVCNGDNFSKTSGIVMANLDYQDNVKTFKMKNGKINQSGVMFELFKDHKSLLDKRCLEQLTEYFKQFVY